MLTRTTSIALPAYTTRQTGTLSRVLITSQHLTIQPCLGTCLIAPASPASLSITGIQTPVILCALVAGATGDAGFAGALAVEGIACCIALYGSGCVTGTRATALRIAGAQTIEVWDALITLGTLSEIGTNYIKYIT